MTTLSKAEVADVLENAAERLELCPWGQHNERINQQKICAEDAIFLTLANARRDALITEADRFENRIWDKFSQVHRALVPYLPQKTEVLSSISYEREQSLFEWNDHPDRTKDEVIEMFKSVAKDLRNQAPPE